MDKDLYNYMTPEEKIKRANFLLKSALVYDHVKFLMTGEKPIYLLSDELKPNATKTQERRSYDKTRPIAHVLTVENPHPDRLRNYKMICENEIEDMECLLQDKRVRMQIVKDIMNEEQMNLKRDFSFCVLNVKARVCESKTLRKVNSFMMSVFSKIRGKSL